VNGFVYIAVDASGQKTEGRLTAAGRMAAMKQLRDEGLTPVSLKAADQEKSTQQKGGSLSRNRTESLCRELSHLLAAGIPISRALSILGRQSSRGSGVVRAIYDDVTNGMGLARAMARHGRSFSRVQVAMVQAGEEGGFLDLVLAQIADFQSHERDLRGRIRAAFAYPAVLMVVAVAVLIFLLTYFIPKFSAMFDTLGGELPTLTRAIVAASAAVLDHGLVVAVVLAVAVLVGRWIIRTEGGQLAVERAVLRTPLIGAILARLAMVRFCRMLGTLIAAGVPLVASLRVASQAIGNRVLGRAVAASIDQVVKGGSLSRSLRSCERLFPLAVVETLAVAEEAGRLETELQRLADVHERELNRSLQMAVSLLEPMVLFIMAALVGTVVVGMLLPIFSLQDLIK
jgi:type II secretory pathway component PulF